MKKVFLILAAVLLISVLFVSCDDEETTYTVSFDMQGHGTQIDPVTAASGAKITKPTDPTDDDYNFEGWYKEEACTTEWTFATDTVTADITLYAKWTPKTFKAVAVSDGQETPSYTLTFYYDGVDHSGENTTVYDNLPTAATAAADWSYSSVRDSVKSIVIDSSVKDYTGLTSTAYMFSSMKAAESITGAENLNVSNVTSMASMFLQFGGTSKTIDSVPDVSSWNTEKVTDMSYMFNGYCNGSETLNAVPDVSKWNTKKVTDMPGMFMNYGYSSETLNAVPDVSKWNTSSVTNLTCMFYNYCYTSEKLNAVPDVSKWNTASVTKMSSMFRSYGNKSTALNAVPDVSKWNTTSVTDLSYMFDYYGYTSNVLDLTLDFSGWNVTKVENSSSMLSFAGNSTSTKKIYIPEKTGEKSNTSSTWYVGDDNSSIDLSNFTVVLARKTGNLLATTPSLSGDGWSGTTTGQTCYVDDGELCINYNNSVSFSISKAVPLVKDGDCYKYEDNGGTKVTLKFNGTSITEITVEATKSQYTDLVGTYKPSK